MLLLKPAAAAGSTWNPADKNAGITLSSGNLNATTLTASWVAVRGTTSKTSGKWHFELTITGSTGWMGGVGKAAAPLSNYPGGDANGIGIQNAFSGVYYNGAVLFNNSPMPATGDIIAVEVDVTNSYIWFKDVTQATIWWGAGGTVGTPANGSGGNPITSLTSMTTGIYIMSGLLYQGAPQAAAVINPGPSFAGAVSSGFAAWG